MLPRVLPSSLVGLLTQEYSKGVFGAPRGRAPHSCLGVPKGDGMVGKPKIQLANVDKTPTLGFLASGSGREDLRLGILADTCVCHTFPPHPLFFRAPPFGHPEVGPRSCLAVLKT